MSLNDLVPGFKPLLEKSRDYASGIHELNSSTNSFPAPDLLGDVSFLRPNIGYVLLTNC